MSLQLLQNNNGFVTLLLVLILSAVGVSIATSLLFVSISADRNSFALSQGKRADASANSCAQEALERIRGNLGFIEAVNITIGSGNCSAIIINTGGENRTVNVTGTDGTAITRLQIFVDGVVDNVHIASWQRVGGF